MRKNMISGKFTLFHYDKLITVVIHQGTVVKHLNIQWCTIVTAKTRPTLIFGSQSRNSNCYTTCLDI